MNSRNARRLPLALAAVFAASCGNSNGTLVVALGTDLVGVGDPLVKAELVIKQGARTLADSSYAFAVDGSGPQQLPSAYVLPGPDDQATVLHLDLIGTLASGKGLTRSLEISPVATPARILRLALTRDCLGVSCTAPGRTCVEGQCVPLRFDGARLYNYVGGLETYNMCMAGSTLVETSVDAAGRHLPLITLQPGNCNKGDVCLEATCYRPQGGCGNGVQDGQETDVDCGGWCGPCDEDKACVDGPDCTSHICQGGKCFAPSCADQIKNQDETDVDCGGTHCGPCKDTLGCALAKDCASGVCAVAHCSAPTCFDKVKNADETDVDCGGATCGACPINAACGGPADCATGLCSQGKCVGMFAFGAPLATGKAPAGFAITDLDGDGKSDIVVANEGSNLVSIFRGNGDGTMQTQVLSEATGPDSQPQDITAADVNGDHKMDLLVSIISPPMGAVLVGGVSVLIGDGTGGFPDLATGYNMGGPTHSTVAVDIDGDGHPDLCSANEYGVAFRLNNGDGTFAAAYGTTADWYTVSMVGGDLNHDGKQDLVAANTKSNDVSVLIGAGDGSFPAGTTPPQVDQTYGMGFGPTRVVLADVNGDGKLDFITADSISQDVSIAIGKGDGSFINPVTRVAVGGASLSVVAADFNGDGILDIASAGIDLAVLLGNGKNGKGDGTFRKAAIYNLGYTPTWIGAADFDGDGMMDLAVTAQENNQLNILLNRKP